MGNLLQDVRYGWRMLRKTPGLTAVIVLMLTVGIGANTAVFSIFNAILLRRLPYEQPNQLVQVQAWRNSGSFQEMPVSYPNFADMRERNQVFSQLGAYSGSSATFSGSEGAEQVTTAVASAGFFETLGVRPILGRTFQAADEPASKQPVVMLTYGGWQRRFSGDHDIIGKTIVLDSVLTTVVGVLPQNFQFGPSQSCDFWRPLGVAGWKLRRNAYWLHPVGRLKVGMSQQQAQSGMQTLARQLEQQYPDANAGVGVQLVPLEQEIVGSVRPILQLLMAAVGFVLLITCANVAGLLLARSVQRQKEILVRLALGAGPARIVRQLLTESVLLALLGGCAGVLAASWTLPAVVAAMPKEQMLSMPALQGLTVDRGALLFSLGLSLVTGILFGLVPAIQVLSPSLRQDLQEMGRSSVGQSHHRFRNGLVVSQVALAVVLLVGAGLMIKSLQRAFSVNPGFKTANLLTLSLSLPIKSYPDDSHQLAFQRQILKEIDKLPGVKETGAVTIVPLTGSGNTSRFDLEGHPKGSGGEEYEASSPSVSSNYFSVMGIPLRAGRFFTEQDNAGAPRVVIVNQALADEVFRGQDPIGKRINFTYTNEPNLREIVGVVGNERVDRLDVAPTPVVYDNFEQDATTYFSLLVRTQQLPEAMADTVRRTIRSMDPQVSVYDVASMAQIILGSPAIVLRAYPAYLLGTFAGAALLLAALGIYGLLAYAVVQKTRELGLRLALGAEPRHLLRLVVGSGMKLTLLGAALGVAGALAATRLISSLLFGIRPTDTVTFVGVCLLLVMAALPATYIPARRATRVDPMVALRYE